MEPGIHDLPFSEYHALDAWGSSSLKAMRRGPPARVLWERENDRGDTAATILGTAVHCALLTPDLFDRQFAIKPAGMNFSTKEGKAWRDDPERAGRTLLSYEVGQAVQTIVEALHDKAAVHESLEAAENREASLLWNCSTTGEACKARPDWMQDVHIYDLKVSRHAAGGYLALRAFSEGWMHQLAHYRTGAVELGLPIIGGRLVVVDPAPPHFVHLLEVKVDALDLLEIENIATLKEMRRCRVANDWPSTPDEWRKVEPPASANMDAMNDVALVDETEEAEMAEEMT
jgi:hypothetical protein